MACTGQKQLNCSNRSNVLPIVGVLAAAFLCQCRDPYTRPPRCGDGVVEGEHEQCDDGNTEPGDGCSPICLIEAGEICDNYEDDDGDRMADCADPDCLNHTACEEDRENCHNTLDDDGDSLTDCEDPDCQLTSFCIDPEVCDNGEDDDRDGHTDCDDMECSLHPVCGACEPDVILGSVGPGFQDSWQLEAPQGDTPSKLSCPQGNGRDVQVRFTADAAVHLHARLQVPAGQAWGLGLLREEQPGATCEMDQMGCVVLGEGEAVLEIKGLPPGVYRLAAKEGQGMPAGPLNLSLELTDGSVEADCDDNVDGDRDGLTDCDDADCDVFPPCRPEICDNGTDDNQDGLTDCSDPQCVMHVTCLPPETCDNGVDDDYDGHTDCGDSECAGSATCTGSDCVVNAELGFLGRGERADWDFDTSLATGDNETSCGGVDGPDVVATFTLVHLANVRLEMTQQGHHVLALATEAGPGSWCDEAELGCADPGGVGQGTSVAFAQLPAARYFVLVDAVTAAATGTGHVSVEVFDPLVELCDDSIDDDGDGLVDCDDPDCFSSNLCLPETACHDGQDNDVDGHVDCADLDCVSTAACSVGTCVVDRDLGVVGALSPAYVELTTVGGSDTQSAVCAFGGGGPDKVLSFSLQTASGVTLRLNQDASADHVLSLAMPAGPGSTCDDSQHLCADAGGAGLPIILQFSELPVGTYYLLVEPYGPWGEGDFSLQVSLW